MKRLASFYEYLIFIIMLFVAIHYAYQLVWAWERFWQGLVLFFLLGMGLVVPDNLKPFFENRIPLDGELYKDTSVLFKIKWVLAYIIAISGIFTFIAFFWTDLESSLGIWYQWLIPAVVVYLIFLIPLFRCDSRVEKAEIVYQEEKLKLEQEGLKAEKKKKAKEKKARAEKRRIKKELDKKKLEEKKIEAIGMFKAQREAMIKQLSDLKDKKEKLESSISNEKEIIKELNKKYPFIGKIVPNRID